jgi:hypothetical protein
VGQAQDLGYDLRIDHVLGGDLRGHQPSV